MLNTLKDMFFDWPLGTILFCLVSLASLSACAMILALITSGLDYLLGEEVTKDFLVIKKEFHPARRSAVSEYNATLKIITTRQVTNPDKWVLSAEDDSGTIHSISVGKDVYDNTHEGKLLSLHVIVGKVTGKIFLVD